MQYDPKALGNDVLTFLKERHLATLSLHVDDYGLHVTPVGFSWDNESCTARVITFADAKKARLIEQHGAVQAVLAQVDGGRWLSLHGQISISADPAVNADAERRYAERYRPPGDRGADRRTLELRVERIIGRA